MLEACGVLGEPDLHGSQRVGRSVVLPDQCIAACPGDLRKNLCEGACGADARLNRHRARKRAHRALEIGMAPLAGDKGNCGGLLAAEPPQHHVPGSLRKRRRRCPVTLGLVGERLREGVVDRDRDLLNHLRGACLACEREHRRAHDAELVPERSRRAGLILVRVAQLVLPGREVRVLQGVLHEVGRRQLAGHLTEQQRRRARIGAQRRERDDKSARALAQGHERRPHEWPLLEVERRLQHRVAQARELLSLLVRIDGGEVERLNLRLQQRVDSLQRERQPGLAPERRAQALMSAHRQSQGLRDRGPIHVAIDREHGLRTSHGTVWFRRP